MYPGGQSQEAPVLKGREAGHAQALPLSTKGAVQEQVPASTFNTYPPEGH
jgi:hypothetical protein